jgi:hypothetical protein
MSPHLAIFHVDSVPADIFADFKSELQNEHINVAVVEREAGGPFAGIEWLMPTFVIGFVASAYFGGFFQEMGKDHYLALKERFKRLYKPLASADAPEVHLVGTKGKVKAEQPYSLYFSLVGEGPDGIKFKLLLRRPISEQDYSACIEAFLDFLRDINLFGPSPEMRKRLEAAKPMGSTMLLVVSPQSGRIAPINPRTGEVIE